MSQGKLLLKNTFIYAVGNFGSKILAFLLLPLFSYYLTTSEFGLYDIILTTVSLLVPIITMQFSEASYRILLDAGDDVKMKSIAITNGLIVICASSVFYTSVYFLLSLFFEFNLTVYFPIILFISGFLPFFLQTTRGLGLTKIYSISGLISVFFVLALNILFLVFLDLGLYSLLIAMILANLVVIVFLVFSTHLLQFFSMKNFSFAEIKAMFAYAWPLIPNTISWWLINAADKYIILYILHVEANGIYGISSRFPAIIALANSVFLMAWQDAGITTKETDFSHKESFFARTFQKFITFELTLVAFLICISQYLVVILLDSKFSDAWRYIPFLFLGVAYSSFAAYIGVAYQRAKKTRGIFTTTIIGGIINILVSILFIRHIGLYAPAFGTFLSFLVVYTVRKKETNFFSPIYVDNVRLIVLTIWCIICLAFTSFENLYINIFFIISSVLVFLVCNRPLIIYCFSFIKGRIVASTK